MGEVAERGKNTTVAQFGRTMEASDIRHRVNVIQEVMQAVMKKDVHYGVIPGCKKPSLYKPGSEVLLATFQIATSIAVMDLSTEDCVRYQVRVIGTHAPSGTLIGEGIGECSSNEDKYKWRKAVSDAEFNATGESRRRIKYGKEWTTKQVRADIADVANTILKMAKKRAQIDMTLTATGASDCFDQDIEDLPEELLQREADRHAPEDKKPKENPEYTAEAFAKNFPAWVKFIKNGKKTADDVIATVESKNRLTDEQKKKINEVKKDEPAPEPEVEREPGDQE
ncbi:hypothetical protein [Sphingomonas sp.]|jgi:hypothetical protein|uniref:hypothetical protein n=1 Tax=Sphingomonas sp. TaxID=28214 RepID=UPI0035685A9B